MKIFGMLIKLNNFGDETKTVPLNIWSRAKSDWKKDESGMNVIKLTKIIRLKKHLT